MHLAGRHHHSSATEELQLVTPSKLAIENVSKSFKGASGSVLALDDVSLNVAEGEFVCLVGASGCGKTTLLNMIAGLEKPDSGTVCANGKPVTGPGRERLVMFQEPALFPWLNVFENVLFGLKLKPNLTNKDRHDVAKYYLELVGLSRFERANIHELSGGMKQRLSLARALAPNPRMLLMDEPFAALDALTREQLYWDLQRIWKARNKTIVFVTHNVREAACLGDRVIVFSPRPGRIREEFAVDLPRPRDINSVDLAVLLLIWEALFRAKIWSPVLVPSPRQVAAYLEGAAVDGTLLKATIVTMRRLVIGYIIGLVVGLPLGLLTARWKLWQDTVGTLALGLQGLPSVCWVPLALLWFGQTEAAMLFVVVMGTLWSVVIATETGVRNVPPIYRRAALTMGSKRLHIWFKVILPAALPFIVSGMKQGWAFAWRSLMAAEIFITILTGFGLGQLLHYGRELSAMEQVIGIMIVIVVIGLLADKIFFSPIEKFLHRRWGTSQA